MDLPTVTVIIPNYNYSKWIPDALASIAIQDYPKKQIVVVDDCSTDNSWETVNELLNDKVEIKTEYGKANIGMYCGIPITNLVLDKNGGPGRARNIGVKLAWDVTHIYAFLDSDDLYMPGKISKSVSIILEDPDIIGAVYSDYDSLNLKTGIAVREYKEPFSRDRLVQECIVNNDTVVTKLALDKAGLYDEEMRVCEDYDLWMRVSERFVIVHIPEGLVTVRVTGEGATFCVDQKIWQQNWQRIMTKSQQRLNAQRSIG
jgi:glycosyltransferase involved in cell wall biosynthesis